MQYVCSSCGRTDVTVNLAQPSIDERFAVGYCESCTPEPTYDPVKRGTRPMNRSVVALVRADVWKPGISCLRSRQLPYRSRGQSGPSRIGF